MNEPPTIPSALGIEAVQWLSEGGENLTVRISGRWRRGRPTWSGQPLLVIESLGGRHRFPAMPEPPSLTGAAPGTWQMSFSVPESLSPSQGSHAWLQLGGAVVVPLPVPEPRSPPGVASSAEPPSPPEAVPRAPVPNPQLLAERRLRSAELAAESARHRAAAAEAAVGEMSANVERHERELELARREPERLNALLLDRERELRATRQRAHAEHAALVDLEERLGGGVVEADEPEAELRVHELEAEIEALRRAGDEAEHVAQAAVAARTHAEEALAAADAQRALARSAAIAEAFRAEQVLCAGAGVAPVLAREPVGVPPADARLVQHERTLAAARPARRDTEAEATIAGLERELAARTELEQVLAELREELGHLRVAAEREHEARLEAEAEATALKRELAEQAARSERAWEAIEQLRAELRSLTPPNGMADPAPDTPVLAPAPDALAAEPRAAPSAVSVEPERFAEALARLRAATPPPEPEPEPQPEAVTAVEAPPPVVVEKPEPPATRWLERALRDVARADPAIAQRLLIELAPGVELDRARVIKRMAAGPIRRALARVAGRRAVPTALRDALTAAGPLGGLELDPELGLRLVAVMIDRGRTGPDSFTLAYQRPGAVDPALYLQVWERDPSVVRGTAPSGRIATTIVSPPSAVTAVLAGSEPAGASTVGDGRPLELVRAWVERAQNG
jgi:hypothetical protein